MSQTVDIPDANFELALINLGVDTNGLIGSMLLLDAVSQNSLNVSNKNISKQQGSWDDNNLSSLNIKNGNNANVTLFGALNNPNLTCVGVVDVVYSESNWTLIDVEASYTNFCNKN